MPDTLLPPVVMLRGLIRSNFHWGDFPERLAPWCANIIRPEIPGNGFRFNEKTPASIHALMEDVRQQVTAQHSGPVIIVAVSMGAMIAMEWARCYPAEIAAMHLINTSLANMSLPWQRMQAPALLSLIAHATGRDRLESCIMRWTMNLADRESLQQRWLAFNREHPLTWANGIAQTWAASRYRGPITAPIQDVWFYNAEKDHLVKSACTARIASKWQKPLDTHPTAGHDLPMDAGGWLASLIGPRLNLMV